MPILDSQPLLLPIPKTVVGGCEVRASDVVEPAR